jgi:hypothetical protein
MHFKSSPKEPQLCDSFARKFSDRYTEPAEYALYAKFKALIMTNDLRLEFKKVLQNKVVIAVNQDKLGLMLTRVSHVRHCYLIMI